MAVQTLLDVVKSVCYEINEPAVSALFGSTDPNALQFLHLLYALGRDVRNRYDYPTLRRKYSFATVSGQRLYPLPSDFWRLTLNTAWDETNEWALFGPEDDGGTVARELGITSYVAQKSFRIVGAIAQTVGETSFDTNSGYFEVTPTPDDVRTMSFEYISANWFLPAQWVASTSYSSGDLVSANGNIYKATSTGTSNSTRPSGESTTTGETGVSFQQWREQYNIMTADTDYPIIDPEVLVAGLKARYAIAKGLESAGYSNQFEIVLANAIGRFGGSKMISGADNGLLDLPNIPNDYVSTGWT